MIRLLLNLVLAGLFFCPVIITAQIYHVDISDEIDLGLPSYLERVIQEAEAANARAILLEINTFGGRVDAATQIKDLLLNTHLETIAYVNKRAISAGAFICISCKKIGMAPGSSIGAATVVNQSGEKAPEKYISYFRTEMRATAEHNGRNPEIAEGMVDEDVEIEGLSEKGKLITLTSEDALKWKMSDYTAPTLDAFLDSLKLGEEELIYTEINWAEKIVRFLTSSVISSALMGLGMLGIFFELQSPGIGFPGLFGVTCLALFFGSHYIISLAGSMEIILFIIGVILILLELFVIPGFGVAGVSGIACVILSLYLSMVGSWETVAMPDLTGAAYRLGGALLITLIGIIIMARFGTRTGFWKKVSLSPEQKSAEGYVASEDYSKYLGLTGIAHTPLHPAGVGLFNEDRLDIVSEGGFIEKDASIKIVRIEGYRLIVREEKKTK